MFFFLTVRQFWVVDEASAQTDFRLCPMLCTEAVDTRYGVGTMATDCNCTESCCDPGFSGSLSVTWAEKMFIADHFPKKSFWRIHPFSQMFCILAALLRFRLCALCFAKENPSTFFSATCWRKNRINSAPECLHLTWESNSNPFIWYPGNKNILTILVTQEKAFRLESSAISTDSLFLMNTETQRRNSVGQFHFALHVFCWSQNIWRNCLPKFGWSFWFSYLFLHQWYTNNIYHFGVKDDSQFSISVTSAGISVNFVLGRFAPSACRKESSFAIADFGICLCLAML